MTSTRRKAKSATTKPVPATPTQVAILETDEESTDLLPQGVIRSEVNFLSFPFFALTRKDAQKRTKSEFQTTVSRGGERRDIYWKVSANSEYGYPRPFDRQVHKAIEHIISEMKPPIQNPVPIGSLYGIAKLMNIGTSGTIYRQIKEALLRIQMTGVHSKGTFYSKGKKRWIEQGFSLYERAVFVGEELDNGEIADTNYLFLGSWYLENINARYVKPLDYTYYRSLQNPIASRLYELLSVKFYGMGNHPYIRYRYSNLCELLPTTRYQYFSAGNRKLEPAHQELIRTGFLDKVEWDDTLREAHDWYVTYYPGTRAREEIQRWSKQEALPPPDDLELGQMPPAPSTPQQADDDVNGDVVNALQNFGISKKQAVRLAKKYPKEKVLEKLDMVQWLVEKKSPLVSKNPQGFLIKAIEDDYPTPTQYKGKSAKTTQPLESEEQEARLLAQEEYRKGKEEARQRLLEKHPPQPIKGTEHTTQSAWSKALTSLQEQVSPAVFNSWLKDTSLLQVTDTAARIAVPNRYAIAWLERKMYREISSAMKGILGKDLDLEFVVASPE